jgi:hypothetical protein
VGGGVVGGVVGGGVVGGGVLGCGWWGVGWWSCGGGSVVVDLCGVVRVDSLWVLLLVGVCGWVYVLIIVQSLLSSARKSTTNQNPPRPNLPMESLTRYFLCHIS